MRATDGLGRDCCRDSDDRPLLPTGPVSPGRNRRQDLTLSPRAAAAGSPGERPLSPTRDTWMGAADYSMTPGAHQRDLSRQAALSHGGLPLCRRRAGDGSASAHAGRGEEESLRGFGRRDRDAAQHPLEGGAAGGSGAHLSCQPDAPAALPDAGAPGAWCRRGGSAAFPAHGAAAAAAAPGPEPAGSARAGPRQRR